MQVIFVEDNHDTTEWLSVCIKSAFPESTLYIANTFTQAKSIIQKQPLNLAILDINLPDGSGIELVPLLQKVNPDVFCVIASIFEDDSHIFDALKFGAQGYIVKGQDEAEIIAMLKDIKKGKPPISPKVALRIINFFNSYRHPWATKENELDISQFHLTERELEVLTLVSKGMNRKEMARLLQISPNTISGYIKSTYQKLSVCNKAEAAVIAEKAGLL